jgi:hypothetical protein
MKRQIVGLKNAGQVIREERHDKLTQWLSYYKEGPISNINRDEIDLGNSMVGSEYRQSCFLPDFSFNCLAFTALESRRITRNVLSIEGLYAEGLSKCLLILCKLLKSISHEISL